jgi:hypothetical protein
VPRAPEPVGEVLQVPGGVKTRQSRGQKKKTGARTHCDSRLPKPRTNIMLDITWPGDVFSLTPASPTGLKAPDRSTGPLIRRDHVGGHSMPRKTQITHFEPEKFQKNHVAGIYMRSGCGRKTTNSAGADRGHARV